MKKKIILLVLFIAVATGAFFGGIQYQKGRGIALATPSGAGSRTGAFGGTGFRRTGQNGGGFIVGQIISQDSKSITVKGQDGSSKIIFLSSSSQISKSTSGTASDLSNGTDVVVTGTTNSDGSITAQNIQIRPPMPSNSSNAPQTQGQ